MPTCEVFPCCGHKLGCCPAFDSEGRQIDMVCTCGARLPISNRSSICDGCMRAECSDGDAPCDFHDDFDDDSDGERDQFNSDSEADADALRSAGWGTDEDYGYYGDGEY